MKMLKNGEVVEVTEEEMADFVRQFGDIDFPSTVSDAARISALEQAIADLAIQTMGVGINE